MNLTDLNKLKSEAEFREARARELRSQADSVAGYRKGERRLDQALDALRQLNPERREAVLRAEALVRDDVLRIVELDLEGQARRLQTEARARRAAIASFFGEEPETERKEG